MEEALTVVKKVYTKGYKKNEVDIKAVNEYATKFSEGLEKGWKQAGSKIDFESPDNKMLNSLKENVWQFSAAKNKEELNQLNALLRDENGKLRSWKSFKEEAVKVTADFKGRYMRVEYDMAVNSSYLAARWEDYDDDAVLVYTTAGDDRVRESHEELDGITLPKNHSFWDTYYPPNGWNCRCTVFPTTTNRRTPDDQIPHGVIDNVPPMFRTNIAKEGLVFPESHPYWKNKVKVPKKEIEKANDKKQERKKEKTIREKHLELLEQNKGRNITKSFGGQSITTKFNNKDGLKHFVNDVLVKTNRISEKDLPKIHEFMKEAKPLPRIDLYKDRKDGIERFYYLHDEKRRVIYQIAERQEKRKNGRINIYRFLYGVVND